MSTNDSIKSIEAALSEDKYSKFQLSEYKVTRFIDIDTLLEKVKEENGTSEVLEKARDILRNNEHNFSALYTAAVLLCEGGNDEGETYFERLIRAFRDRGKWGIVEHLCRKVLTFGDVRFALRVLITCLQQLKKPAEISNLQERLVALDPSDTNVMISLADQKEKEGDIENAVRYYQLSLTKFIQTGQRKQVEDVWLKLVMHEKAILPLFNRLEDKIMKQFEPEFVVTLLQVMIERFDIQKEAEAAISIYKRILAFIPNDKDYRAKLVDVYEKHYEKHHHLEEFVKLSGLKKWWRPVFECIKSFEEYIRFDNGVYVFHHSWGIGQIQDIEETNLIIDFIEKKGHHMSLDMALSTLELLPAEHIRVYEAYRKDEIVKIFNEEPLKVLEIIINGFPKNEASIDQIKNELCPALLTAKNWTKWWNKTKKEVKLNPHFHLTEKAIMWREEEILFSDEIVSRFQDEDDFSSRVIIADELMATDVNNQVKMTNYKVIDEYFKNCLNDDGSDIYKKVESIIMLHRLYKHNKNLGSKTALKKGKELFADRERIVAVYNQQELIDNKKILVNELLKVHKENTVEIITALLLTRYTKMHDTIINILLKESSVEGINAFIVKIIEQYRERPDVFIWAAKNLMNNNWDIEGIQWSIEEIQITLFYTMAHLNRQLRLKKKSEEANRLLKQINTIMFSKRHGRFLAYLMEQKKAGKDISNVWNVFIENKYVPAKYREEIFLEMRKMERTILS